MKKITKILSSIAFVFVLMLTSTLFVACANKDTGTNPVNVENSTYKTTGDCFIDWADGVTEQEKKDFLGSYKNEEEYLNSFKEDELIIHFESDGFMYIEFWIDVEEYGESCYYKQSKNLKKIAVYKDEECTRRIDYISFTFESNKFYLNSYNDLGTLKRELTRTYIY